MSVRYPKECVNGEWPLMRLSDEEIIKLRTATAVSVIKCIKLVRSVAKAAETDTNDPIALSPADVVTIVKKVAPSYSDQVEDYIRGKIWLKAHPVTPPAAAK